MAALEGTQSERQLPSLARNFESFKLNDLDCFHDAIEDEEDEFFPALSRATSETALSQMIDVLDDGAYSPVQGPVSEMPIPYSLEDPVSHASDPMVLSLHFSGDANTAGRPNKNTKHPDPLRNALPGGKILRSGAVQVRRPLDTCIRGPS
jgi:hypothetical protein